MPVTFEKDYIELEFILLKPSIQYCPGEIKVITLFFKLYSRCLLTKTCSVCRGEPLFSKITTTTSRANNKIQQPKSYESSTFLGVTSI